MTSLKKGDKMPALETGNNEAIAKLQQLNGKKKILYFYPKDNTPGCTAEACNFRDNYNQLSAKSFEVFGVSPDSEKSHQNFISKFELPFTLIADTDHKVIDAYGVWGEKKMYGKAYFGVERTTFVIDETGHIELVITKVDTKDSTAQLLNELNNK